MAHTLAYLRINTVVTDDTARLATGLPGSALTGRDLHPLDDYSKISSRHRLPPIPFRPALPGRFRRRGSRFHIRWIPAYAGMTAVLALCRNLFWTVVFKNEIGMNEHLPKGMVVLTKRGRS